MKKFLAIIGAMGLFGTSTSTLIACGRDVSGRRGDEAKQDDLKQVIENTNLGAIGMLDQTTSVSIDQVEQAILRLNPKFQKDQVNITIDNVRNTATIEPKMGGSYSGPSIVVNFSTVEKIDLATALLITDLGEFEVSPLKKELLTAIELKNPELQLDQIKIQADSVWDTKAIVEPVDELISIYSGTVEVNFTITNRDGDLEIDGNEPPDIENQYNLGFVSPKWIRLEGEDLSDQEIADLVYQHIVGAERDVDLTTVELDVDYTISTIERDRDFNKVLGQIVDVVAVKTSTKLQGRFQVYLQKDLSFLKEEFTLTGNLDQAAMTKVLVVYEIQRWAPSAELNQDFLIIDHQDGSWTIQVFGKMLVGEDINFVLNQQDLSQVVENLDLATIYSLDAIPLASEVLAALVAANPHLDLSQLEVVDINEQQATIAGIVDGKYFGSIIVNFEVQPKDEFIANLTTLEFAKSGKYSDEQLYQENLTILESNLLYTALSLNLQKYLNTDRRQEVVDFFYKHTIKVLNFALILFDKGYLNVGKIFGEYIPTLIGDDLPKDSIWTSSVVLMKLVFNSTLEFFTMLYPELIDPQLATSLELINQQIEQYGLDHDLPIEFE